jgi:hypothetical protein
LNILFCYTADRADQDMRNSASVGYRCRIPAIGLTRAGHKASLLSLDLFARQDREAREKCDAADILVLQRSIWRDDVWDAALKWQGRGKPLVLEFDDSPQHIPPSYGGSYVLWRCWHVIEGDKLYKAKRFDKDALPPAYRKFKERLPQVDAITVPSMELLNDWRTRAKSAFMLPNCFDPGNANWRKEKGNIGGIAIGAICSQSHMHSWEQTALPKALTKLCKQFPDLRVMIFGDKRVSNMLKSGIGGGQLFHHEWRPFDEYPNVLRYFDIGVAPMFGPYDERKSDQKIAIDYPLMRIPWVASKHGPYRNYVNGGGFLVSRDWQWEPLLRELITDEALRTKVGAEGYQAAQTRSIDANVVVWERAYKGLLK